MCKLFAVLLFLFVPLAAASPQGHMLPDYTAMGRVPLPEPAPHAKTQQAQAPGATNPNPFPQPGTTPAPPTTQPPVIVQTTKQDDTFNWIWAAIAGLFTLIFGARSAGEFRKPKIGELLQSNEARAHIDALILKAIGTGYPGQVVSQIPGVGLAEPLIRRVVSEVLERRIEALRGGEEEIKTEVKDQSFLLRRLLARLDQLTGEKDEHHQPTR